MNTQIDLSLKPEGAEQATVVEQKPVEVGLIVLSAEQVYAQRLAEGSLNAVPNPSYVP
ncbi:MAG: hypothetical protein LC108_11885 [Anaerolineales bacterium]|nr:hypothetical protein [Anaerolineales bacterium]